MKVNINLYVPAIGEEYDVLIPSFLRIDEVISLLVSAVEEISNNNYVSSKHEFLCRKEPELLLLPQKTFDEYNIKNGEQIIMI